MSGPLVSRLSIATLALAFLAGCGHASAPLPTQVDVQAVFVHRAPITQHIQADAVLSPRSQAVISSQITAPVKEFFVQRGSKVHKGELLAVLDNQALEAAVVDNQGAYTAAQAQYETATESLVPESVRQAKLNVKQTLATLKLDQQIVNSRQRLYNQGAIPGRELDTAKAALVQAQASYDLAVQHDNAVEKVGHAAALKSAQGALESAKGKYLGAEAQLQYSEIRSPINGVVTNRPLYAGETVVAGTPLLTVMDTGQLIAKVHLTQAQAQQLSVGAPASVRFPGLDTPVVGKLTLISPAVDPGSTTVEVWVAIDNRDGRFKPGDSVHVSITGQRVSGALLVPVEALVANPAGGKAVMVIGPDHVAHLKPVTVGIEDSGMAQILSGISAGDQVVTAGAYALGDGTPVKVVNGSAGSSAMPEGGN